MNKRSVQPPASLIHAKSEQLARSDKPPSVMASVMLEPQKPDSDIKLWMTYRECRLRQFNAGR